MDYTPEENPFNTNDYYDTPPSEVDTFWYDSNMPDDGVTPIRPRRGPSWGHPQTLSHWPDREEAA